MTDADYIKLALRLARRGLGRTSPNPIVGAVLVKGGKIIGRGWHHCAGAPHAEIEALGDAERRRHSPRGATLYVTLEPCCTHGRTPPCTAAIIASGIKRVVVGTTDPNPKHAAKGYTFLRRAGVEVVPLNRPECADLNTAFNHWIVHRTPYVTVKAAMTLDGKIATASGESKWITGPNSRAYAQRLRQSSDAILVGVNTILADDPSLTARRQIAKGSTRKQLRRIILDSLGRTPLTAKVVTDEHSGLTTIVVSKKAPKSRITALAKRVNVLIAPLKKSGIDLRWLLKKLGLENVTNLLVEGGGEVNDSFLLGGYAQAIAFFYAPKVLGGHNSHKAVAGDGVKRLEDAIRLHDIAWRKLGEDFLLTAKID